MEVLETGAGCFQLLKGVRSILRLGQNMNGFLYLVIVLASIGITSAFFTLLVMALFPSLSGGLFCGIGAVYFGLGGCLWLTPSYDSFLLWIVIAVLLAIGGAYVLFAFFITLPEGPAILFPPIIQPTFFIIFDVAFIAGMAWLLALDNFSLTWSLAINVFMIAVVFLALALVTYNYERFKRQLVVGQRFFESAVLNVAFLNGLSMLLTWLIFLAFVNVPYIAIGSNEVLAAEISIIAIGVLTTLHFTFDVSFLERWTRFVVTPYIVIAVGMLAAIHQNRVVCSTNSVDGVTANLESYYMNHNIVRSCVSSSHNYTELVGGGAPPPSLTFSRSVLACAIAFAIGKFVNSLYNMYLGVNRKTETNMEKIDSEEGVADIAICHQGKMLQ